MHNVKMIQFRTYKQYNFSTVINGVKLKVRIRYNSYLNNYYMNVDELVNGKFINVISSVMLYTGVNLFQQHPQLNLGYLYIVPLKKELYSEDPKAETIQNFLMLWVS